MDTLLEASRQELIDKSKSARRVKSYGTTRWDRKNNVSVFATDLNFDKVDMNALFKGDLLNLILPVHGETNDYSVEVLFEGVCTKLRRELERNNFKLEYKIVYRAIVNAVNDGDILVACSCPDFVYRQSFQATKGRYNAGKPELRPAKITNPNDTEGAGCKHIMNILGNLDWAMKLATCINNYILYMKDHMPDLFAQIIWPAISGMSYEEAEEQGYFGDVSSTLQDSEGPVERNVEPEVEEPEDFDTEEPEDFDTEEPKKEEPLPVAKSSLENFYNRENHTKEETMQRFHITEYELDKMLDEYGLRKVDN